MKIEATGDPFDQIIEEIEAIEYIEGRTAARVQIPMQQVRHFFGQVKIDSRFLEECMAAYHQHGPKAFERFSTHLLQFEVAERVEDDVRKSTVLTWCEAVL